MGGCGVRVGGVWWWCEGGRGVVVVWCGVGVGAGGGGVVGRYNFLCV